MAQSRACRKGLEYKQRSNDLKAMYVVESLKAHRVEISGLNCVQVRTDDESLERF